MDWGKGRREGGTQLYLQTEVGGGRNWREGRGKVREVNSVRQHKSVTQPEECCGDPLCPLYLFPRARPMSRLRRAFSARPTSRDAPAAGTGSPFGRRASSPWNLPPIPRAYLRSAPCAPRGGRKGRREETLFVRHSTAPPLSRPRGQLPRDRARG